MPALAEGLRLLNRADPFVEIGITDKGEQLLGAAGEVHLETCVKDLRERFARVEFQVRVHCFAALRLLID
jgi:ribosome assembly protein 1